MFDLVMTQVLLTYDWIFLEPKEFIKSVSFKGVDQDQSLMVIKPTEVVGRTFLSDPMDNGERHRARIVKALDDHQNDLEKKSRAC